MGGYRCRGAHRASLGGSVQASKQSRRTGEGTEERLPRRGAVGWSRSPNPDRVGKHRGDRRALPMP